MISDGHFLSDQIQKKIDKLTEVWNELLNVWEARRDLYEQNLDVLVRMNGVNNSICSGGNCHPSIP